MSALLFQSSGEKYEHLHDLKYDVISGSWIVSMNLIQSTIVIPQLAVVSGDAQPSTCGSSSTHALDCAGMRHFFTDPHWINENVVIDNVSGCPVGLSTSVTSATDVYQTQLKMACSLRSGFLCVLFPSGLQITRNDTQLSRFNQINSTDTVHIRIRMLHLTFVSNIKRYEIHSICSTVHVVKPVTLDAVVSIQNECASRGLRAPEFSSMRLTRHMSGLETCVWDCRPDYVRWPWNSDPLLKTQVESNYKKCRPISRSFVSVQFTLQVEMHVSVVVPALLSTTVLDYLNVLAAQIEQAFLNTHSNIADVIVLLGVQESRYQTQEFDDIITKCVAFHKTQEYHHVIEVSQTTQPQTGNMRRISHTTDIQVQGILITHSVDMSPAGVNSNVRAAIQSVVSNVHAPANTTIMRVQLTRMLKLDRVIVPGPSGPRGKEVIVSAIDKTVIFIVLACLIFVAMLLWAHSKTSDYHVYDEIDQTDKN